MFPSMEDKLQCEELTVVDCDGSLILPDIAGFVNLTQIKFENCQIERLSLTNLINLGYCAIRRHSN
jgi:hypothetical protein